MTTFRARLLSFVCLCLAFSLASGDAFAAPRYGRQRSHWTGNLNLFLGQKTLDDDDWRPVEEQQAVGIQFDVRERPWPISLAVDLLASSDKDELLVLDPGGGTLVRKVKGETTEVDVGFRKVFDEFRYFRPYFGGGLAFVSAKQKTTFRGETRSDDDDALGFWVAGGAYVTLADMLNLGLDFRWSRAEVELFGRDVEAGGFHAGLLVGYHW
jgi:hypothetical protein